jgi:hypothetical protein
MISWAVILLFSACVLVGVSILLIKLRDPARFWDHLARSAVQLAVGAASVALALLILQLQFDRQEIRTHQRALVVSQSIVRSLIEPFVSQIAVAEPYYRDLKPVGNECATPACKRGPPLNDMADMVARTRLLLNWRFLGGTALITVPDDISSTIAQMVRSTPGLSALTVLRLARVSEQFGREIRDSDKSLQDASRLFDLYVVEARASDKGESDPERERVFSEFASFLATAQARRVAVVATLTCNLIALDEALSNAIASNSVHQTVNIHPDPATLPSLECPDTRLAVALPFIEWHQQEMTRGQRLDAGTSFPGTINVPRGFYIPYLNPPQASSPR